MPAAAGTLSYTTDMHALGRCHSPAGVSFTSSLGLHMRHKWKASAKLVQPPAAHVTLAVKVNSCFTRLDSRSPILVSLPPVCTPAAAPNNCFCTLHTSPVCMLPSKQAYVLQSFAEAVRSLVGAPFPAHSACPSTEAFAVAHLSYLAWARAGQHFSPLMPLLKGNIELWRDHVDALKVPRLLLQLSGSRSDGLPAASHPLRTATKSSSVH